MFYMMHSLASEGERNSWFTGNNPFTLEKVEEILKKNANRNSFCNEIAREHYKIMGKPTIKVQSFKNNSSALISLLLPADINNNTLCSVQINTVEYNCGAIHINNLYSDLGYSTGLAWMLLELVEDWCRYAGYTLLFGNTAGYQQNQLVTKFESLGWEQWGPHYVNARSGNKNIWLRKLIAFAEEVIDDDEPEEEEYYDDDNNRDEDF